MTAIKPSYYTVHKRGARWSVVLVSPIPGLRSIKTRILSFDNRGDALVCALEMAAHVNRPFKTRAR